MPFKLIGNISIFLLVALIGFSSTAPSSVQALDCATEQRSPPEQIQDADAVFIGTILLPSSLEFRSSYPYEVRVDRALKGVREDTVVSVYVDPTWGSKSLEPNRQYLMILSSRNGQLTEPLCAFGIREVNSSSASPFMAEFDMRYTTPKSKENRYYLVIASYALAVAGGASLYLYWQNWQSNRAKHKPNH